MTTDEILQCTDINLLFKEKVCLTEKIGSLHKSVRISQGDVDEVESKADLTTSYAVLEIINYRLEELEEMLKQTRDEESRIRYNFMKIAKQILTKDTYEKIRTMSENALREIKPMFKELRQNKVSS